MRFAVVFFLLFALIGCDKPARVDIGELVEALNALDKDEVADTDEVNTDDDLLVCEEGEKVCEGVWVMRCEGGGFVQFEECVDCGPLCQCAESAGNAWCEHTDPGPDDIDVQPDDSVVVDEDAVDEEPDVDYCGECLVPDEDYEEPEGDVLVWDPLPDVDYPDDSGDTDDDVVPDVDVDTSTMSCTADVCVDSVTGLMWQRSNGSPQSQYDAVTYCENLPLSSHNDWRLPTISELRTIIKGCPDSEAGGACGVEDPGCLDFSCWTDVCYCEPIIGPGENGFYWESDIWDTTAVNMEGASCLFWSSSVQTDATTSAWDVDFRQGFVYSHGGRGDSRYVRCVRDATLTRTTKQWGGVASEYGHGVAVDSNGNIFVAGRIDGTVEGDVDAYLTKWNADGSFGWTKQWGTDALDYGWTVAVDPSGNVFVAGQTQGDLDGNTNAGERDIFLTKWNADGTKAWTKQWGNSGADIGWAVATDNNGNIFVTGTTMYDLDGNTSAGVSDIFLTKWTPDGTKAWTKLWGTTAGETGYGVATDSDGNIFIAGQTDGSLDGNTNIGFGSDAFLTKWNANGTKAWTKQWGTTSGEGVTSVAVDTFNNIFVAGYVSDAIDGNTFIGARDLFITKWNADGTKAWTKQWGTTADDFAQSVATDNFGNIFVTGYTGGAIDGNIYSGSNDVFLTKFNVNGLKQWTRQWGTTLGDVGWSVVVDPSGRIIVTGATSAALDDNTFLGEVDAFLSIFE